MDRPYDFKHFVTIDKPDEMDGGLLDRELSAKFGPCHVVVEENKLHVCCDDDLSDRIADLLNVVGTHRPVPAP